MINQRHEPIVGPWTFAGRTWTLTASTRPASDESYRRPGLRRFIERLEELVSLAWGGTGEPFSIALDLTQEELEEGLRGDFRIPSAPPPSAPTPCATASWSLATPSVQPVCDVAPNLHHLGSSRSHDAADCHARWE